MNSTVPKLEVGVTSIVPSAFSRTLSKQLERIDYHLIESKDEREAIFRLRYKAYLREGGISPNRQEEFSDFYDDISNTYIFGAYIDGELASSTRITIASREHPTCQSLEVFPDFLQPQIDAGKVIVESGHMVSDEYYARLYRGLSWLTLRLSLIACEHFRADLWITTTRAEHQAFYKRAFNQTVLVEPRPYPPLAKPVCLMGLDYPSGKEQIYRRYEVLRPTSSEGERLFARGSEAVYPRGSFNERHGGGRVVSAETAKAKKIEDASPQEPSSHTTRSFEQLRREIDRLFHDFAGGSWRSPSGRPTFDVEPLWRGQAKVAMPAIDIAETGEFFEITAELPGVDEKNIEIKVVDGVLTIMAEKQEKKYEKGKDLHLSERSFGSFQRAFHVSGGVDIDGIEATFERGILTVSLPKRMELLPAERKIEVKELKSLGKDEPGLVLWAGHGSAFDQLQTASPENPSLDIEQIDKKNASSEKRHVNGWIEDGEPPLKKGRTYRLGVNIGRLREKTLASADLPNIDWGGKESLELLVVVGGYGFSVDRREQILSLPRHGDSKDIFFAITPVQDNSLLLRISLYLARELTLLEEFEIPIEVQSAAEAA
jgi:HSP20 family molecular chaperone IbpA